MDARWLLKGEGFRARCPPGWGVAFAEGHTGVAMISFFFSGMDRTFRTYLEVLRRPGAARPAAGTALASLPIGMLGLSVLLLVQRSTGRFAAAGAVVGLLALGTGVGILAQGRLIDRFGPPRVLLPAVALQLPALLALVLAARASAGMWTLGSMALVAGACEPQVGGSLRGLWSVLAPAEQRQAAIALSSTLFEVAVVTGPLLLVAVLAVTGRAGGVLASGACFTAGTLLLTSSAACRSWRPARRPAAGAGADLLGALANPGMRTLTWVAAVQGTAVRLVQVASVAIAAQHGALSWAPWCTAALATGSMVGTIAYGSHRWRIVPARRIACLLMLLALVSAMTAVAPTMPALLAALLVAGLVLGPVLVTCFTLVDHFAPTGTLVGGFTTLTAAGLGATAAGNAAAGWLVERASPPLALLAAAIAALAGAALTLLRRASLGSPPHRASPPPG